jgi:glutamate synthase domain-containing protein 2
MCPTHAIYVRPLADEGRGIWSNSTMVEIKRKSQTGSYKVRGCGLTRRIPTFDDLSLLPAQVSRPPIDSYRESCKTSVVLGDRFAENPIEIDTPIMIGAMSFGALSKEAKIALAIGSSKVGTITNTGEGGMLPEERHYADKLIAQYASGRFGVSASYLNNAEAVEIKIGQGAKSGMGGHLLSHKVTAEVARVRNIPEGTSALSPARHMDIVGPEDLGMKINQLREITDWKVPIIVKFASGRVEQDVKIAAKAGADIIVVCHKIGPQKSSEMKRADYFRIGGTGIDLKREHSIDQLGDLFAHDRIQLLQRRERFLAALIERFDFAVDPEWQLTAE